MSDFSKKLISFVLILFMSSAMYAFEDGQIVRIIKSGRSLMVENSSLEASKKAVLWTETNTHSQRWRIIDTGRGTFYLQNVYTQLYLGGITAATNKSVVGQITKNLTRGAWELVPVEGSENKYHIFINRTRRFALSSDTETTDGTGVMLLTASTADPAQIEWEIEVDEPDGRSIDQLSQVIDTIKNNPDSRRMIVSAWNPGEVDKMALPPCHCLFQFYVAEGKLSCQLYQRSADTFLGVPFNIASYSLLTMMIAQVCGLQPGEFVHTTGDTHIYLNHFEQVDLQLSREPRALPVMRLNPDIKSIFDFDYGDFTLEGYDPWPAIKAPVAV